MGTATLANGDICSFSVYPAGLITSNFKNCIFRDRVSYQSVRLFGYDAAAQHANVFPTLPDGTVNDPTGYDWLTFEMENGELQILGEPWIKSDSLVIDNKTPVIATIYDRNEDTIEQLKLAISSLGYTDYVVENKTT